MPNGGNFSSTSDIGSTDDVGKKSVTHFMSPTLLTCTYVFRCNYEISHKYSHHLLHISEYPVLPPHLSMCRWPQVHLDKGKFWIIIMILYVIPPPLPYYPPSSTSHLATLDFFWIRTPKSRTNRPSGSGCSAADHWLVGTNSQFSPTETFLPLWMVYLPDRLITANENITCCSENFHRCVLELLSWGIGCCHFDKSCQINHPARK